MLLIAPFRGEAWRMFAVIVTILVQLFYACVLRTGLLPAGFEALVAVLI
jgi:hypothetical protein